MLGKSKEKVKGRSRFVHDVSVIFNSYSRVLFVFFFIFLAIALYFTRTYTQDTAYRMTHEYTARIGTQADIFFESQKNALIFYAETLDNYINNKNIKHCTKEEKRKLYEEFLTFLLNNVRKLNQNMQLDIYSTIDGTLYAATPWEGDATLNFSLRHWYRDAVLHPGLVVIQNPYLDLVTNMNIITMSITIGDSRENVLALDIYLPSISGSEILAKIPENYLFYLTDKDGEVILYSDNRGYGYNEAQRFVNSFFGFIKSDPNISFKNTPIRSDNSTYNIFAYQMPKSHWYAIMLAKNEVVFKNFSDLVTVFFILSIVFVIICISMLLREFKLHKAITIGNEVLRILGNTYQVILRVNLNTHTFVTVKQTDNFKKYMRDSDKYSVFYKTTLAIIDKNQRNDFAKIFSIENIRNIALKGDNSIYLDFLVYNRREAPTWFSASVLCDSTLKYNEVIICLREINQAKIKQIHEMELLSDSVERLKESEKSKQAFFAAMSHDMRTPLNGILGLCQLAFNNNKELDKVNGFVDKIYNTANQLLSLVNNILEISKLESYEEMKNESFDLQQVIEQNLYHYFDLAKQSQKTFSLNFKLHHHCVTADKQKIIQVLNNLISNSFKYSEKGAVISCIVTELKEHHNRYYFEITDTGIGMSPEYLKEVFTPYTREGRSENVTGTGLGMPIVKNLISKMNGEISIQSVENQGTTVGIVLPLSIIPEERIKKSMHHKDEDIDAIPANQVQTQKSQKSILDGLKILIAEDNELNMEIATEMLQMRGAIITQAKNGLEALNTFVSNRDYSFDVILMDMRMPVMDGCQSTIEIRHSQKQDAKIIPIIAVTANAFTEDITATRSAGMNAHISKPIDFKKLEATLERLVRSYHAKREAIIDKLQDDKD